MTSLLSDHRTRFHAVAPAIEGLGADGFARMPYSCRIFAENLLRTRPATECRPWLEALAARRHDVDFPFMPARVVLQDLLGTPALVDLAGLRDAVAEAGGDPRAVNPAVPTHLVVDHSLNVEVDGGEPDAMARNMEIEQRKNAERFEFLDWCRRAFDNVDVLMPGNGILHQVNLEHFSPVVSVVDGVAFPDTLVGTDSHTTMINALGVLGWGVGGIEAESVMLGRPVWLRLPEVVGVKLTGRRQPGVTATDLVLALTEFLRAQKVVGSIIEFGGDGVDQLGLADRATIANMGPEFGATAALFAIDQQTLDFLRLTGRADEQIALVETYAKAQGLWRGSLAEAEYDRTLVFDISSVGLALAGPANPHDRVPLSALIEKGLARDDVVVGPVDGPAVPLADGAVVIAAITSCTNTSNPRNMIAAGLLAKKALARGLRRKPWVKTSLAPGSRTVERYLGAAGLLEPLAALGFGIIGFGCTSCNGMSGPLPQAIEDDIIGRGVRTVAVLSGNRNFNGRIHPRVREAYIASPPLVVAYAIAGNLGVDIARASLGHDADGQPVLLADLWPSDAEIDAVVASSVRREQFHEVYEEMFPKQKAKANGNEVSPRFAWRKNSLYIRRPPYWQEGLTRPAAFAGMRPLAMLGDNVTTDDLSPSGAILPDSATGRFLLEHGVEKDDFNSYGTRRGDHVVAVRATFANNRLKNEMASGKEGSFTRLEPEGVVMPLFDAAQKYLDRDQELIVVAGRNYGSGSSRDWAAKGVRLLGVRAVVCENFERIHRSNLVGMGILPLEFQAGTTRKVLQLDGSETYALEGLSSPPQPGAKITLVITKHSGERMLVPVISRIDTTEEASIFAAGGLLPRIRDELLKGRGQR